MSARALSTKSCPHGCESVEWMAGTPAMLLDERSEGVLDISSLHNLLCAQTSQSELRRQRRGSGHFAHLGQRSGWWPFVPSSRFNTWYHDGRVTKDQTASQCSCTPVRRGFHAQQYGAPFNNRVSSPRCNVTILHIFLKFWFRI